MLLFLSFIASIVIWTLLFNFKLAITLITAIFIHEYGHFYWMGREGINDKFMSFIPPFGAVAMSRVPWPSYGAELRIALAGPTFGLLSVLLFFGLWLVFRADIFLASIALACIINGFNLMFPIPILDGGRVIKSILYSIHWIFGDAYYIFGFLLLGIGLLRGFLPLPFTLLISFFLYWEWSGVLKARSRLRFLKNIEVSMLESESEIEDESIAEVQDEISRLEPFVNMKNMSIGMMVSGALFYLILIYAYLRIFSVLYGYIDVFHFHAYFN